ncbi:MAG: hypothetical protein QM534_05555 [Sediminibacterium sp.]|nr:hypothetical protein [Sediminibacterium sp.]
MASCLSSKKFSAIIDKYYADNSPAQGDPKIMVSYNTHDTITNSKKLRSLFIPAIFYWKNLNELKALPASKYFSSMLKNELTKALDSAEVLSKIKNLNVAVYEYDNSFIFHSESHVLFAFLLYSTGSNKYILTNARYFKALINIETISGRLIEKKYNGEIKIQGQQYKGETNENFIRNYLKSNDKEIKSISESLKEIVLTDLN